ncbi:MAG TPA: SpoIIE family protein phosphatase [Candidatus Acidoferrales bacterium]|nr:SpoIIE family protein phosphatase [Candidatus Acidoferrales bacterium]
MAPMAVEFTNEAGPIQASILIADDQPDVLEALRLLLKGHGYVTETVASPAALVEAMARRDFDLVLMDLNYARDTTSGREGLDVLAKLKSSESAPPIVVMTGWATVGLAVEAMQRGVGDFVEKPWVNSRLLEILQKQIEIGRERRSARRNAIENNRTQNEIASQLHRREREIEEARAIQIGFLPKEIPQIAGYEIAGAWQPARVVGGDYYDVFAFGENTLGLCIADVAGKGMPAALLMSNLQATVRGLSLSAMSPELLCERLNTLVCRSIASDRFITFFYAHLDGASRQLRYSNAGHNAPIVAHRDGTHERLDQGGGVLGIFQSQNYVMGTHTLLPQDRVLLFTDGVTEACNAEGEEFGDARLIHLLRENGEASAEQLQKKILDTVGEFCGGNWHDDATLIVVEVE